MRVRSKKANNRSFAALGMTLVRETGLLRSLRTRQPSHFASFFFTATFLSDT